MRSILLFILLSVLYFFFQLQFMDMESSVPSSLLSLVSMLVIHVLLFLSAVKAGFSS